MKKTFAFYLFALFFAAFTNEVLAEVEIDAVTGVIENSTQNEFDFTDISKKLDNIETNLRNQRTTPEDNKISSAYLAETENILQNAKNVYLQSKYRFHKF